MMIVKYLSALSRIGDKPENTDEEKLHHQFLIYMGLLMSCGGIVWGTICLSFDLMFQATIPYSYTALTALNLLYFRFSKNFVPVRFFQVLISLMLPFLFQWSLGGFVPAGGAMLWAILALIGTLTFHDTARAVRWLIFYMLLTIISGLIEYHGLLNEIQVTDGLVTLFFVLNFSIISSIVFCLMLYFVWRRDVMLVALEESMERALSVSRTKSAFLANMSHEIRTPLNSIVGFSQILLSKSAKNNFEDSVKQQLGRIRDSGMHLTEIINSILDLAKIEAGKMTVAEENVAVKNLVEMIYQLHHPEAARKTLVLEYTIGENVPDHIRTDRTKLCQILINLVSNAIKFTSLGTVSLSVDRRGSVLIFSVRDQGAGIPEQKQKQVFEAFQQVDSTSTRAHGGTGLGLSITKSMVELLGGKIWLESKLYTGSTFFVELPCVPGESESNDDENYESIRFSSDNTVLVAEDNEINQEVVKALFEDFNLYPLMTGNGEECIQSAIQHNPDLILMDLHMPVMDGDSAIRILRQNNATRNIPIVVLSAEAFTDKQKELISIGADDYLTKPVEINKLVPILKRYLRTESAQAVKS